MWLKDTGMPWLGHKAPRLMPRVLPPAKEECIWLKGLGGRRIMD